MKRILHLSDFHIHPDTLPVSKNEKIIKLISFIKDRKFDSLILLYTGDIVDCNWINSKSQGLDPDEKADFVNDNLARSFDLAGDYFEYIQNELSISKDKTIICCGNHDVSRSLHFGSVCENNGEEDYAEIFTKFNDFSYRFTNRKENFKTHYRRIDCFNFIIANSNWTNKEEKKNKVCISCHEVNKVFSEHIDKFSRTKEMYGKNYNIFVSHIPSNDFCETAQFPYASNDEKPIIKKLNSYFGIWCSGDKHTYEETSSNQFIVGAPLDKERIVYGLYEFHIENATFNHKFLSYDNDWSTKKDYNTIEDIYDVSKNYLKNKGLSFFNDEIGRNSLEEIITWFDNQDNYQRWENISTFFKSFTTFQKASSDNTSGENIDVTLNLFDILCEKVNKSGKQNVMSLRGLPKVGKSLFLTIFYTYLLRQYLIGKFDYIPLYINYEYRTSKYNWEKIKEEILAFFEMGNTLSRKYNTPVCIVIDGLSQHKFYSTNIEEFILEQIRTKRETNTTDKIILCIDTDDSIDLPRTEIGTEERSEYLLYFNQIGTFTSPSNILFESIIKQFCLLYGYPEETAGNIKKNIENLKLQYIDLNFLYQFESDLIKEKDDIKLFDLYIELKNRKIKNQDSKISPKAAFELYYSGMNYEQIKERCGINYKTFERIKNEKLLSRFLIAQHYADQIAANDEEVCYDENSILNQFVQNKITVFIKGVIEARGVDIRKFSAESYEKLNYKGKSTLTYLFGRIKGAENERYLEEQKKCLDASDSFEEAVYSENWYFKQLALRSVTISKIKKENDVGALKDYIEVLISNERMRKVNRVAHLLYYGDLDLTELNQDAGLYVKEGFDFFNTYQLLVSSLSLNMGSNHFKDPYPVLDLELFTLCDIIETRLQIKCCSRSHRTCIPSFLYSQKQKHIKSSKTVLNKIRDLIDHFIELNNEHQRFNQDELFIIYLKKVKKDIEFFREEGGSPFEPHALTNKVMRIEKEEKIGWKIKERTDRLSMEDYDRINQSKSYESVISHIYEAYLIGLLYLPKERPVIKGSIKKYEGYDKQKILNLILIHDLGESEVGDFPPFYDKIAEIKSRENEFNQDLFISGIYFDVADLTDYLDLWRKWCDDKSDINVVLAREIDKIQLLRKLNYLKNNSDIGLSEDRIKELQDERRHVKTELGKRIYKLVCENGES